MSPWGGGGLAGVYLALGRGAVLLSEGDTAWERTRHGGAMTGDAHLSRGPVTRGGMD